VVHPVGIRFRGPGHTPLTTDAGAIAGLVVPTASGS
jgi:hypothetical protein